MSKATDPVPKLSVVICAHNSRRDHLEQVLKALRQQSLDFAEWELVLVDNASNPPLDWVDLSWQPQGRMLREAQLGLTPARLCGIAGSRGGVVVFVDDDVLPAGDDLENILRLAMEHPSVGAWGGQVQLEFESPPPDWTRRHWPALAYREFTGESISTSRVLDEGPLPNGASLCVRRAVARAYAQQVRADSRRYGLDRKGPSLMSAGDTDLVLVACDLGLARALFSCLRVRHLIPPNRLQEDYLVRLTEDLAYSIRLLGLTRTPAMVPEETDWSWWVRFLCAAALRVGRRRRFFLAYKRGHRRARQFYEAQQQLTGDRAR